MHIGTFTMLGSRLLCVIFLCKTELYGGTKVTGKIYFILRAHAVANTCARISYYVPT